MDKVWYLLINQKEEGPYSLKELRFDNRLTLETLVWKEGFPNWVPLKKIKELRKLVESPHEKNNDKKNGEIQEAITSQSELALESSFDPSPHFLLILLIILLICYLVYQY